MNPNNMGVLQLQCQATGDMMYISQNDFNCLSHYFERKVAAPPYRPNAAKAFITLLCLPPPALSDLIKLMNQELQGCFNLSTI